MLKLEYHKFFKKLKSTVFMIISFFKLGLRHWPAVENNLNIKLNALKYFAVWLLLSNYAIGFSQLWHIVQFSISERIGKFIVYTNRQFKKIIWRYYKKQFMKRVVIGCVERLEEKCELWFRLYHLAIWLWASTASEYIKWTTASIQKLNIKCLTIPDVYYGFSNRDAWFHRVIIINKVK